MTLNFIPRHLFIVYCFILIFVINTLCACMCVGCACVHVHLHVRRQVCACARGDLRLISGVFFNCSSLYNMLRLSLLLNVELTIFGYFGQSTYSRNFLFLLPLSWDYRQLPYPPGFYMVPGGSNSSPLPSI